jgi:hypothetical protein
MKKLKRVSRLTAAIVGLSTTVVLAYFVGTFVAEGSFTGTTGSGGGSKVTTETINASFPNGELTPTHPVSVTASIDNTTSRTLTFTHVEATVETAPGHGECHESWYHVTSSSPGVQKELEGEAGSFVYSPGEHALPGPLTLSLEETGSSQEACEGVPVTVHVALR